MKGSGNGWATNTDKFTEQQLKDMRSSKKKMERYTWHHNAQSSPNNMQLVPKLMHSNSKVPHTGQNSLIKGK
ncbi:HNH endonuclease [Psychrobacter urativorans]|uniref:HNH endonuclease n=1 Tax=Psychrobacter urativorans TaxID=45610 RepID=UPI001D120286